MTGGTGTLGRVVVELLEADGHEVREVSRRSATWPIDLRTGDGLEAALTGAEVVVHCASTQRGGDEEAARHLVAAAKAAGVRHVVYISIVGVDVVPLGYYRAKLAVEKVIAESGVGWTVLRTTQFHDLVVTLFTALAKVPLVLPVPSVRLQPVEVREVAVRLADLAVAEPAGRVPDMGGPEVRPAADLARAYLAAGGRKRLLVPFRLPGKLFGALRRGGGITPEHADGKGTFEEFLAADK
ncbi:SDR family oxidoreductase [Umezawaea sp. NPDC059074]|uniref:SDR family oxidoreductase n=1 Tax=Umezawaea sp. NPDC059074 TaxID=3346716 RepID=UPI003684FC5D